MELTKRWGGGGYNEHRIGENRLVKKQLGLRKE